MQERHGLPPFLPLSPQFRPKDQGCWLTLYTDIAQWLVSQLPDQSSVLWVWGREAFWLAFIAAHPVFPHGDWPRWPSIVSLDGPFVLYWMARRNAGGDYEDRPDGTGLAHARLDGGILADMQDEIWARFRRHIAYVDT